LQLLQDVASKGAILVRLRLRDMFLSATNLVGLSVCSSLITVGFSTSKQQFVRRLVLLAQLAHGGGGNDRTLVDRRRATMTVIAGPLFEEGRILEEEKVAAREGWKGAFVLHWKGRRKLRVGRTRG
jgi:hypothetical protein